MRVFLRKYNTDCFIDFDLYSTDGSQLLTSAVLVSGCCIVSRDNSPSVYSVNLPVVAHNGFRLNLTSDELTCKSLHIKMKDTNSNSSWLDTSFCVESYGTSASQHGDIASGMLENNADGITIKDLLIQAISQLTGEFLRNGDAFTYLKRDGTTSHVLSGSPTQRVRLD